MFQNKGRLDSIRLVLPFPFPLSSLPLPPSSPIVGTPREGEEKDKDNPPTHQIDGQTPPAHSESKTALVSTGFPRYRSRSYAVPSRKQVALPGAQRLTARLQIP